MLNFFNSVIYSSANKCLLKVAMYSAQMEEYAKALEIYEQVGISFEKLNLYSTNNVSRLLNCQVFMPGLLHSFIPNNDRNLSSPMFMSVQLFLILMTNHCQFIEQFVLGIYIYMARLSTVESRHMATPLI